MSLVPLHDYLIRPQVCRKCAAFVQYKGGELQFVLNGGAAAAGHGHNFEGPGLSDGKPLFVPSVRVTKSSLSNNTTPLYIYLGLTLIY